MKRAGFVGKTLRVGGCACTVTTDGKIVTLWRKRGGNPPVELLSGEREEIADLVAALAWVLARMPKIH